jgi:quinolinate synthase
MRFDDQQLLDEIREIKREKKITILAHYYQRGEVQEIADYIGDSLALAQHALANNAKTILVAGVHFMAETAKIISPKTKVLIPDLHAGCSLAESCPPDALHTFLKSFPDHKVVSYINCSAEIKAMSSVICTSSNAELIINSIPRHEKIVFVPDKNLGKYLIAKTGRELVLWDGTCVVHEAFAIEKLLQLYQQYPDAEIVAHPEAEPHLLKVAHFVGSTSAIISYVQKSNAGKFLIATEAGILHTMRRKAENKLLIPAPVNENNTCACSECSFMKMTTLEKIRMCLLNEHPVIELDETLRLRALKPLLRMLQISKIKLCQR